MDDSTYGQKPAVLIQNSQLAPIFLGASLLIPPKEAIQHEKLAEWMKEHEPTVTHLTPAMGQLPRRLIL